MGNFIRVLSYHNTNQKNNYYQNKLNKLSEKNHEHFNVIGIINRQNSIQTFNYDDDS